MNHPDGTPKTCDELWLEEILETGRTPSELIDQLEMEMEDPRTDAEDIPWIEHAIEVLKRLQHS